MKKLLITSVAVVAFLLITFSAVSADSNTQDILVLTWEDGTDYFVKAGSLDYTPGHPDVAPEFSCLIEHNGEIHHYEFMAKGLTVLYIDGEFYGDSGGTVFADGKISGGSAKSRFIAELYEAICDKLIYHRQNKS